MKAWWANLSTREQALIALAAAIFALFLLAQFVASPLANWRVAAKERAEQAANDYRIVMSAAAIAKPSTANAAAQGPGRNALTEVSRRLDVALTFVNEHEDGSVEFQAGPVDPSKVFELFSALDREFALRTIAVDIARSAEAPSQVRLQATIAR